MICDRFADSTRAYQGAAGGAPASLIEALEKDALDGLSPDLTLVLDLPVQAGLARAAARREGESRFEEKGEAFHQRLRDAFLQIAEAEPGRCAVVDAAASEDAVDEAVWAQVQARLGAAV